MSYIRLSRHHQHHRTRIKSNTDPPIILMIHPLEQQETHDVTYVPMTLSSQHETQHETPIVLPLPLPLQLPLALVIPDQYQLPSTLVRALTTTYDHDRINRCHIRSHSLPIHTMDGPTNAVVVFPHRSPTAVAMSLSHPQTLPLACTPNPRMYHLSPSLRSSSSSSSPIMKRRASYSTSRHHPYQQSSRTSITPSSTSSSTSSSSISSPCESPITPYRPLGLRLLIPHHDTGSITHLTSRPTFTTPQSTSSTSQSYQHPIPPSPQPYQHPIPPSPQPPPFRSDTYQPPPLPFPFPLPFPSTLPVN